MRDEHRVDLERCEVGVEVGELSSIDGVSQLGGDEAAPGLLLAEQFFLPHQDSEKDDAMVGTLVVSLRSAHTGGELVVEHGGESVTYRVPREELSFVAFYADCRHEVKPVKSGYRVTLTFNLLAESEADAQGAEPVADLAHCLSGHFTTPATRRYGRGGLDPRTGWSFCSTMSTRSRA